MLWDILEHLIHRCIYIYTHTYTFVLFILIKFCSLYIREKTYVCVQILSKLLYKCYCGGRIYLQGSITSAELKNYETLWIYKVHEHMQSKIIFCSPN